MKLGAQHFFLSKIHLLFTFFQKLFNMHIRKKLITRVEILKTHTKMCYFALLLQIPTGCNTVKTENV